MKFRRIDPPPKLSAFAKHLLIGVIVIPIAVLVGIYLSSVLLQPYGKLPDRAPGVG